MELEMWIDADGETVQHVYDDRLAPIATALGVTTTRRASHVEPHGDGWAADMSPVGGPVLLLGGRPFRTRAAALKAERAWLDAEFMAGRIGGA